MRFKRCADEDRVAVMRLLPLSEVPVESLDAAWEASARTAERSVQDQLLEQADRLRSQADDASSWRCLTAYRALVGRLEAGTSADLDRAAWTVQEDPARDDVSRRLALVAVRHAGLTERMEAERTLAECDLRSDNLPEAEQRLRRMITLVRGRGDALELNVAFALALTFAHQKREIESLIMARRAQEVADRRPDLHVVHLAHACTALSDAYRSLGDDARMVWCAQRLLALAARLPEPDGARLRRQAHLTAHEAALLRGDVPSARAHLEAALAEHARDLRTAGHLENMLALTEAEFALRVGNLGRAQALLSLPGAAARRLPGAWVLWGVLEIELLLLTERYSEAHGLAREILARVESAEERRRLGAGRRLKAAESLGRLLSGPGGDAEIATRAYRCAADAAFERLTELERCVDDLPGLSDALPDDRAALSEYRRRFASRHRLVLEHLHDLLVTAADEGRLPAWATAAPGGMTAVCAWCRCVRGIDGRWLPLGHFVNTGVAFSVTHGICDRCVVGLQADARVVARARR
jgi:hypothetical protein